MKFTKSVMGAVAALLIMPIMLPSVVQAAHAPQQTAAVTKTSLQPNFGLNVKIFEPSMPISAIQATVDAIANEQVNNEMGPQRYALLFKPGTYGTAAHPLIFQVGYYTEVAGLGASPTDVTINGHVDVYNRCFSSNNCIALDNFWRSLSNLTINVTGLAGCRGSANFWAVSQAAPVRRVNIVGGNLSFMDYCTAGPFFASGGFMADSKTGFVVNGSQQQFLVRNSSIGGWSNGVWNQVFSGVTGAPAQSFGLTNNPPPPYTTLATSPVTREKPFLYMDSSGNYNVFVPDVQYDSAGTTWANGPAAGTSIPIDRFFIADPSMAASTINLALLRGMNVIFTPGIYHLNQAIRIMHPDTVVLGLGFPTLVPTRGNAAMAVSNTPGVKLAGLLFDAGPVNSPVLLQVGFGRSHTGNAADPTLLSDVFFRIGGATPGKATTSLVVDSDNVLLDDVWAWRADHGNGVGWTVNTAATGVIVNGNNVTAYGLFVEHYQKYEVIWNGNNGTVIFFQNEMPYDPPNQAAWMNGTMNGYAAFKVGNNVASFQGWGMGSYCNFAVNPSVNAYHAFEAPTSPGVQFHDLLTISLGGVGTITHVINDTGATAQGSSSTPVHVVTYP